MEESPTGEESLLPNGAKELLNTAFNRYNKVLHLDDGNMGGGEMIPFDEETSWDELDNLYNTYFLHGDENNWRRGVFRYGLIVYDPGRAGFNFGRGRFVVSSMHTETKPKPYTERTRDIAYASVYMHETGHTLRIFNFGVDNRRTFYPWQIQFWVWGRYRSCMNYCYTYRLVDYSDGSRGILDSNDWGDMSLTSFQDYR